MKKQIKYFSLLVLGGLLIAASNYIFDGFKMPGLGILTLVVGTGLVLWSSILLYSHFKAFFNETKK